MRPPPRRRRDGVTQTPYELIGGAARIHALVDRFYSIMAEREPALTALHATTPAGTVDDGTRHRFALFLEGWLGGPQTYTEQHGHPRLRMRHGRVGVDLAMRDAWLRCMTAAMDDLALAGPLRAFLDKRFADVADFMRNREG